MSNVEPLDKKLEKSKKWIHALSLDVNTSSTAVPPPTGTTANPFQKVNKKRSREGRNVDLQRYLLFIVLKIRAIPGAN